ncbi:unnamed protein product [Mytilus coruscus]|uniref:Uncharacterized protein n=1 Tax=Mytilus coruscus TaxID=42192 RepID=A0A6J8ABP5_MYTCO|nr:unnamed protein product [Mytilus coruscus]
METTKVLKRKGSKELTFDYKPENGKAIQTHSRFGSNKKKFKDYLESESICIQELKYSSKVFPSVYFTQISLRQNQALKLLMNPLEHGLKKFKNTSSLLILIMDQPNVVIVRYGKQTEILPDLDFFQNGHYEELDEFDEGYIHIDEDLSNACTPYVVVFVVRTVLVKENVE